jgi:Glycosyl transferase family 2
MTLAMSVVLPVPIRYSHVRRTIRHLRAQSARNRLEVLLVVPAGGSGDVDAGELNDFGLARVVQAPRGATLTECRVAGVLEASAPIVAFAEDHSFPEPGWAELLLRAHEGPYAAVAPAFENANPRTALSWADVLLGFGPWIAPVPRGEMSRLPWHNTSYKRESLLAFGDRLGVMLEVESMLQEDLRARGLRLYLESEARTRHVNFSRVRPFLVEYLVSGRMYGGRRAQTQKWSPLHRLIYIAGSPFIPVVRLPEVVSHIRRIGRTRELLPRALPAILLGLVAHSLGELAGYACGAGTSGAAKSLMEFDRARFVVPEDRDTLA